MSFNKIKYFLIFFIVAFLLNNTICQSNWWNLLLEKKQIDISGNFIIETDSQYVILGIAFDTFPSFEQGITISLVNKKNAVLLKSAYYEIEFGELDFDYLRKIKYHEGKLIFPMFNFSNKNLELFTVNIPSLEIRHDTIKYAEAKGNVFIEDFLMIDDYFYILVYIDSKNDLETGPTIIKINKENYEVNKFKIFKSTLNNLYSNSMIAFNNGILIASYYRGTQIITGGIHFIHFTTDLNTLWEYNSNSLLPNWNCEYLLAINEKEFLYVSTDPKFNYSTNQVENRFSVMRFNMETKNADWYTWWNEPRKSEVWFKGRIVKGFNDKEYLLMANDIVNEDTSYYSTGKIVKFNDFGQRIWQKTYYHTNKRAVSNHFDDIIRTNDTSYLVVGSEYLARTVWLVKIDEDGNILPIDTTSSTVNQDISPAIPEIKVYPNPASHSIIINQGEITGMTYQLITMSGEVIKTLPIPHAHHNTIWDISEVPVGNYIINMLQGGKVIGTKQVVIIE